MAEAILARWKEYSPVQQRKAAAILGALVADAAGRLAAVYKGPVLCQAAKNLFAVHSLLLVRS